jgi:hypothetical protein
MLIRQKEYWQLRLGPLVITRVRPVVGGQSWGDRRKPGTLSVWLGQRLLLQRF